MDGHMSTTRILLLAIALGFAAGFSWVVLTSGATASPEVFGVYAGTD